MKVKVEQGSCIGCGVCQSICDKVFSVNDDGVSQVLLDVVPEENKDDVNDAVSSCPTGAIVVEE